MNATLESLPRRRRFPIVWFTIGFAICDFIIPVIVDNAGFSDLAIALMVMFWGVMAGQFGLLIIWAVLGPGKAGARQAFTMLLAVFLWFSFLAGAVVLDPPSSVVREMGTSFLFLPLIFSIAQLPLWCMKLMTGGRIVQVDRTDGQSPNEGRQFGLRHVMGVMVVAAVALSLANSGLRILGADDVGGWTPLLIGGLASALWGAFATRPCIWAALSVKKKAAAALAVAIYTVLMTMLVLGVLGLLSDWSLDGEEVLMFFAFHATLMGVILGTLHVARLCGYTFMRRSRRHPDLDGGCPFAVQDDSRGVEIHEKL